MNHGTGTPVHRAMTAPEAHAAARELEQQADHMNTLRDRQHIERCEPVTAAYLAAQEAARKRAAELRAEHASPVPTGQECAAYIAAYLKSRGWVNSDESRVNSWQHIEGGMKWGIGGAFQRQLESDMHEERRKR